MENETQDPQIVQPDDAQEQEQQIVPDEMTATDAVDDTLESEPATNVEEEDVPAAEPENVPDADDDTSEKEVETAPDTDDDALESEPATIVEEEETPAATPQQPRGNRDSNIRRNPLTIIMLVIFGILFMLWLVRNCEGIKEEQKLKGEFRESFENRRAYPDIDSTYEEAEKVIEADKGERPSIEVREQREEEPKAENDSVTEVNTMVTENAAPTENIEKTEPNAPAENIEKPAQQEDIPQPATQEE